MLREFPCEQKGMDLLLGGCPVCDDLEVGGIDDDVLIGLNEHSALDLLHLVLPVPVGGSDRCVGPEKTDILLDLHDLDGALIVSGADDGLDEVL